MVGCVIYVALLRGINVGGKNKVAMSSLKQTFENAGMTDVVTYINSGNVVFKSKSRNKAEVEHKLEAAIKNDLNLAIRVLLRDLAAMRRLIKALPANWTNDANMRCDVLFLWKEHDKTSVVKTLPIRPEIEDVVYVPGTIIWRVDRSNQTKSGLPRIIGSEFYKSVTIRNSNTVRKLVELMEST
ncbi:DUF1697 domain-containing protein [soil metagenome]